MRIERDDGIDRKMKKLSMATRILKRESQNTEVENAVIRAIEAAGDPSEASARALDSAAATTTVGAKGVVKAPFRQGRSPDRETLATPVEAIGMQVAFRSLH